MIQSVWSEPRTPTRGSATTARRRGTSRGTVLRVRTPARIPATRVEAQGTSRGTVPNVRCRASVVEREDYGRRGDRDRDNRRNRDVECYNCHGFGHMARDCREKNGTPPLTQRGTPGTTATTGTGRPGTSATSAPRSDTSPGSAPSVSSSYSAGGEERKNTDVECYKCHNKGHFARDCKGE